MSGETLDLARIRQLWETVGQQVNAFTCPKCGGHWFGSTSGPNHRIVERECHDEHGIGCRWRGGPDDGMSGEALHRGVNALLAEVEALRGALAAESERTDAEGRRVGIEMGCDTAHWMAEEIIGLRARVETLERELSDLRNAEGVKGEGRCPKCKRVYSALNDECYDCGNCQDDCICDDDGAYDEDEPSGARERGEW